MSRYTVFALFEMQNPVDDEIESLKEKVFESDHYSDIIEYVDDNFHDESEYMIVDNEAEVNHQHLYDEHEARYWDDDEIDWNP